MGNWRLVVVGTALLAACGGSTNDAEPAGSGGGNGSGGASSGGASSSGGQSTSTGGVSTSAGGGSAGGGGVDPVTGEPIIQPPSEPPPGPSLCGGAECAASEACCLLTLKCFARSSPADCEAPEPAKPDPQGQKACGSSSHCADGEYCEPAGQLCGGAGFCRSKTSCGFSSGTPWCGCDGKTYPNTQTACSAGVKTITYGECGKTVNIGQGGNSAGITRTLCGQDSQCKTGERCCAITGFCYTEAQAALCALPPEGTTRPCVSNADCLSESEFCDGEGCDGPGGCKPFGTCGAVLDPVCGCDGKSYVNAPCAASAGVRIASQGQCENAP